MVTERCCRRANRVKNMRILVLEPYDGGSHAAFLRGWIKHSRHDFTVLSLPPRHWKWRMRHAALTFAAQAEAFVNDRKCFDLIFCTDMVNLAEFRGLAPAWIAARPAILYFHENQMTYPVREERERDLHFGLTNMISALAADAIWFNSSFHRHDFLTAIERLLARMPDHVPTWAPSRIREVSTVQPPGVFYPSETPKREAGPLRIVWAARWEHDKNPEAFFRAMRALCERDVSYRLSVIGEQFSQSPPCFEEARLEFADRIDRWGFQTTRAGYLQALAESDVFVSTAGHEFFGIAAVEAAAQGCVPALPHRLAYPEVFASQEGEPEKAFLYDETVEDLVLRLLRISELRTDAGAWDELVMRARACAARYDWRYRAAALDEEAGGVLSRSARVPV